MANRCGALVHLVVGVTSLGLHTELKLVAQYIS